MTVTAYISAGSNLDNREGNLQFALSALSGQGALLQVSSIYETEPVGYLEQPWFLNLVAAIETPLAPRALLEFCLHVEQLGGRTRTFPNAPRTLDLDILFFGELVIREEGLIIPHPRIAERRFVLEPLAEIAPGFIHPVLQKSVSVLLRECPDRSAVRKYEVR